ncbi:MAG: magnesium transporter [Clostridiales bacterium]|nr:magnesium transporter [Clostridiales bacterium]MDD6389875.1 magnesium transporter [Bacillota bacterium]MDY5976519.1 magnesium transporter [Anaerovoracaceae bacterium]
MDNTEKTFDESIEEILELLENRQYRSAREMILRYNSVDIAEILEEILVESGKNVAIIVFRMLPKDVSVEVFSYLPSDDQMEIINGITDIEVGYIIDELDFDDKIDVLEELPANIVDKILEKTPKEERKLINTFLNYPDDCAGSLMTPDYISLQKTMTVQEALDYIKEYGMDSETVYTCYVKSLGRKLEGIVSLRALVTSEHDVLIEDIMREDFISVNVYDDQEEVSDAFIKYGFMAIPVVDKEDRLVGIVTFDDIMDVIEEETTEDIERMAGIIDFEDTDKDYLDISVFQHARNRLPWLLILMIAYIFTGMIITSFESKLSEIICLVAYMPLLMGTGGNTGSQAATLIIRGLATDEVDTSDTLRILWKEIRIGCLLGIVLSVFNFARVVLIDGNDMIVAVTVCSAMLFIVIIAKILGSMIPLLCKKIRLDPALIANPAISSISDAVALSIYFAMAAVFLGL